MNEKFNKEQLKQIKTIAGKKQKEREIFKGKFLKKPKVKIESISPQKFISGKRESHSLVREGRTGYFNDEYKKEMKWLEK